MNEEILKALKAITDKIDGIEKTVKSNNEYITAQQKESEKVKAEIEAEVEAKKKKEEDLKKPTAQVIDEKLEEFGKTIIKTFAEYINKPNEEKAKIDQARADEVKLANEAVEKEQVGK